MSNLINDLKQYQEKRAELSKPFPFEQYLKMVIENPKLAHLSHQRVSDMVISKGRSFDKINDIFKYDFFKDELFGVDEAIATIMKYFESASPGSEISRRMLLLYGPPSSGKSQFSILLKEGLEKYTNSDEGAVYAIAESPMHENPLLLIPNELRKQFKEKHGIHIEGTLSPITSHLLKEKYNGDFLKVPIKRIFFSEKDRVGITTFLPGDPKSQDISELTGSIDLKEIGKYGAESDPRAFRFDGAINKANRGMIEFIEMLKSDAKFLYVLLTLSQEKNIKVGRFPLIYCDEVIVAHTNETEFNNFYNNKEMEAFHDRIIAIPMPYNLKLDDEIKIYKKLLEKADLKEKTLSPHTLRVAAMFAILTRLEETKNTGMSLFKKMKLYNGEEVEGASKKDVKKLRQESKREGMEGLSPRYIINCISAAAVSDPNVKSVSPLLVIRTLRESIRVNSNITDKNREHYLTLLQTVVDEYASIARKDVKKAFFVNFQDEITNLLDNYIDNIKAYLDGTGIKDPITGEDIPPKESFMREIEEHIHIPDNSKDEWRNEICRKMLDTKTKLGTYDYQRHSKLKEALEEQMFKERSDIIRLTVSSRNPDENELRKINEVIDRLIKNYGYCNESANELLRFVNSIMNKKTN